MTTTQEPTMTATHALPIGPLTYVHKGLGDYRETYAFVPSGEPAWTSPSMRDGKVVTATYVPGHSFRISRGGVRTSSFAVALTALRGGNL